MFPLFSLCLYTPCHPPFHPAHVPCTSPHSAFRLHTSLLLREKGWTEMRAKPHGGGRRAGISCGISSDKIIFVILEFYEVLLLIALM